MVRYRLRAPANVRRPENNQRLSAAMKAISAAIEVAGMSIAVIPPVAIAPEVRADKADSDIGRRSIGVVGGYGRHDRWRRHRQADSHIDAGRLGAGCVKARRHADNYGKNE